MRFGPLRILKKEIVEKGWIRSQLGNLTKVLRKKALDLIAYLPQ